MALPWLAQALRAETIALQAHRPIRVRTDAPSLDRVVDALRDRRARDATWPFRVLWTADPDIQEVPLTALRARVPIMTLPGLPALTNPNRLRVPTPDALRAWGVRYVVSDRPTPPNNDFVDEGAIGPFHLFRNESYRGLATAPDGVRVEVTKFEDDEVRLQVRGAPADGAEIRLAMAWYPRLRAREDGRAIDVLRLPEAPGAPPMLVGLRVHDGEVVLRPDRALPGTALGFLVSILSIAGLVVVTRVGRSTRVDGALARARVAMSARWARVPIDRLSWRHVLWVGGGASTLALATALGLGRARTASPLLRGFGGDRAAVAYTDLEGGHRTACLESLALRQWRCALDALEEGVPRVQVSTAMDPAAPGEAWAFGRPFSAIRVEDPRGRGVVHVTVRGFAAGGFLHVRMAGVGVAPAKLTVVRPGAAPVDVPIVHGWSTVALPGDRTSSALDFAFRFEAPGGIAFHPTVDDEPSNPRTAQVP
jgi:hypothetical protein